LTPANLTNILQAPVLTQLKVMFKVTGKLPMKKWVPLTISLFLAFVCGVGFAQANGREYHVSVKGSNANDGTASNMLRTIQAAAEKAQPGDTIIVHEGVYRERVNPPRGGESDKKRITYQAAKGEKVEIKGSEIVKDWVKVQDDTWKAILPNSFFGGFNPYSDLIHGDWFNPKGREHHTGAVYLNGEWLTEAAKLDEVLKPAGATPLWFAQIDKGNTTIWAQFKGANPNEQTVEVNVRRTVFYPEKTGINYITVRGFTLRDAATPWAPPTAEQIGVIGTHWSKGWLIENNNVSHSVCSGISLGKYGDEFDNTSADTAEGYVKTIERALANGWNKETVGSHIVRNNIISHCEQTGIVGSLGPCFSTVTGNEIHDIHVRQLFTGAEMAGIKFHGAIDVEIRGNHIYRTCLGTWLDWMAQGARVTGNLYHDNIGQDLFVEVDHGPFLVDNNIFLTPTNLLSLSQGGAYIHNLMAGGFIINKLDERMTPFHKAHTTELAGMHNNPSGDDRYYNNLLIGKADLRPYDTAQLESFMNGNVFLKSAQPSKLEQEPLVKPDFDPGFAVVQQPDGIYLKGNFDTAWATERARKIVTSDILGHAIIPYLPYENRDGSSIRVGKDYFGTKRATNPFPGPFELTTGGEQMLKVWPLPTPQK
jgi:alpha-N-arabinofuranosidase